MQDFFNVVQGCARAAQIALEQQAAGAEIVRQVISSLVIVSKS